MLSVDNAAISILKIENLSDTLLEFIIIALWVKLWNSVSWVINIASVRVPFVNVFRSTYVVQLSLSFKVTKQYVTEPEPEPILSPINYPA